MLKKLTILLLETMAENRLSRITGRFSDIQIPVFAREAVFKAFAKSFGINLNEVEKSLSDYHSINEFFTRKLKKRVRQIEKNKDAVISPCDGSIIEFGNMNKGKLLQIKGIECSLYDLLLDPLRANKLSNGIYITIRLRPKDYHRVHYPVDCEVSGYRYIPGRLMTVHPFALKRVPDVFIKNERIITYANSAFGKFALIMVGAANVGRIKVTFDSLTTNTGLIHASNIHFSRSHIVSKGSELGYFNLGSTVILLFERNDLIFNENLKPYQDIFMGQAILKTGDTH